jgi:hypothetical protein
MEALRVYASTQFRKDINALTPLFTELKTPAVPRPKEPETEVLVDSKGNESEGISRFSETVYQEQIKQWIKDTNSLTATTQSLYNIVWGQCSKLMRNKLCAVQNFQKIETDGDVTALFKEIRGISHQLESNTSVYDSLDEAKRRFYLYKQGDEEPNAKHLQNFKTMVEVIEHFGGNIFRDDALIAIEKEKDIKAGSIPLLGEKELQVHYQKKVRDKMMGTAFLKRANGKRYDPFLLSIRDQFAFGINVYPTSLTAAYELLENYTSSRRHSRNDTRGRGYSGRGRSGGRGHSGRFAGRGGRHTDDSSVIGMQYAQNGEVVPGRDGGCIPHIKCWKCGKFGHYSDGCPDTEVATPNQQHAHQGTIMADASNDSRTEDTISVVTGVNQHINAVKIKHEESDDDSVIVSFQCLQKGEHSVNLDSCDDNSILIDTGSTCSVFKNRKMLMNLRKSAKTLRAYTNGGHQDSTEVADLPGFFEVWYNKNSMVNILAWSDVRKHFRITANTPRENTIVVHLEEGKTIKFKEIGFGLYLFDNKGVNNKSSISGYSFLTLVRANKTNFTRRELQGADKAIEFHRKVGLPGYNKFFKLLESNYWKDCPITTDDAKRALHIYGKDVLILQGKTTRKTLTALKNIQHTPIPTTIQDTHPTITLSADYLYIQGIPMLHTISQKYKFRTIEAHPNIKKPNYTNIKTGIQKVINMYHARNLLVTQANVDNEFTCIRDDIRPTTLNVVAAGEHVGDVERSIRTVKESTRCHIHRLPFKYYPKQLIIGCMVHSIKCLNDMLADDSVSEDLGAHTLITGLPEKSYRDIIKLNFGDYVQAYNVQGNVTNNNNARTVGAIALYASGNVQGGWYFLSLLTGKRIHRYQWTVLPMGDDVIERVHEIARAEGQNDLIANNFKYEWQPGQDVEDHNDEDVVDIDDIEELQNIHNVNEGAGVPMLQMGEAEDAEIYDDNDNAEDEQVNHDDVDEQIPADDEIDEQDQEQYIENDETHEHIKMEDIGTNDNEVNDNDVDEETIDVLETRSTRARINIDYATLHKTGEIQEKQLHQHSKTITRGDVKAGMRKSPIKGHKKKRIKLEIKDMFRKVIGITMSQMSKEDRYAQVSVKEGIKRYGHKAIEAVMKEYAQLDDRIIFDPQHADTLTRQQKYDALNLITMVKEKRCGKIKGRACADGRKQRKYISKEDVTSPTVQLESLMLSLLIDAQEGRDVATADATGAFLLADMEDMVVVKIIGETADIMCQVNKSYEKYITYENGKKVLYMKLIKALYSCMQSAMLWYETFKGCLEGLGFKLNPYDPCVANKTINSKQCTICWYVDDNKISHVNPKVVDWVINKIESKFGKMTVKRGSKHTFVGIDFEMTKDKTVQITMKEYINESIEAFGEKINREAKTPGKSNLFEIDNESELLDDEKAEIFHHIVSKLLYVSKRAR